MAVRVCPQRGPGLTPWTGNGLGRGAGFACALASISPKPQPIYRIPSRSNSTCDGKELHSAGVPQSFQGLPGYAVPIAKYNVLS